MFNENLGFVTQKPRVLIVDNDARARVSYQVLLMQLGYEPVLAMGTGKTLFQDAKEKARQARCALALIDLRLLDDYDDEDTSGLKLAEEIGPLRPIILSGSSNQKVLRDLINYHKEFTFVGKGDKVELLQHLLAMESKKVSASARKLRFDNINILNEIMHTALGALVGEYLDQFADVLARLFPDAQRLGLEKLDTKPLSSNISTVPRPTSVILKVYEEDFEPVVVKLARAEKIQIEIDRYYQFISRRLTGSFMARLERNAVLWDIGGASYSYLGDFDVKTFTRYYEDKPVEDVKESLHSFFDTSWSRHYARAHDEYNVSLYELYSRVWGDWYKKHVEKSNLMSHIDLREFHKKFDPPDPIKWFKLNIVENQEHDASWVEKTRVAVTHGDLHGDNLLIDSKKNAWVIDFERSGEGHALQDFVELEADIINRIEAHNKNIAAFFRMCLVVTNHSVLQEFMSDEIECGDPGMEKALRIISYIRLLAGQCTGITDVRQYLLGLLFNTIFRATIIKDEAHRQGQLRALMLASIICHRLDHWGQPWPPNEWKDLLLQTKKTEM